MMVIVSFILARIRWDDAHYGNIIKVMPIYFEDNSYNFKFYKFLLFDFFYLEKHI